MILMPVLMLLTLPVVSPSGDGGDPVGLPDHPAWCPGLYVRIGDAIVDAPEASQQVAMGYPYREDPFIAEFYDGAVVEGPAVDFNRDITSNMFEEPGILEVQWIMDGWESNVLTIEVVARETVAL